MTNLVLLSISVVTNAIPEHYSGPKTEPYQNATPAIAFYHPTSTNVVTNYVFGIIDGTNRVPLVTFQKL